MFPRKSKVLIGNSIYIAWDESYFINICIHTEEWIDKLQDQTNLWTGPISCFC
jgi:hypothetical protein